MINDVVDAQYDLGKSILSGQYNREKTLQELDRMEREFGEYAFTPYRVNKKEKPWGQDYLDELTTEFRLGAGSKEFFLHLQEVKEEVDRKKRNFKLAVAGCIAGIVAIIVLAATIITLFRE